MVKQQNNTPSTDENDEATHEGRPNKSKLKRESEHLLHVGEQLISLKASELSSMDLPEELEEAIHAARKIASRSGLKRQRQYIGKIMRQIDSDVVEEQLQKIKHLHDTNTARFRKIESWRDRLIEDDKTALTEVIAAHPEIDKQHIKQLIRQAKREAQNNKPPAAARKLFKYLEDIVNTL